MNRNDRRLTRRRFLGHTAGGLLVAPSVLSLACGSSAESRPKDDAPVGAAVGPGEVLLGLYPKATHATPDAAVTAALGLLDFSWLSPGDSVLIKVAANSGHVHPATTHPAAVRALVAELGKRGAGRVLVGDQSGVEWARLGPEGRFSSTREQLSTAGILAAIEASGAEAHLFDENGWDAYFEATPPAGSAWQRPLMLPNVIREVDHIVYLPRLSAHVIAGYTHALKLSVGWLRDDSRNHLHVRAGSFYENYTDVNYVPELRDRIRLAVSFADKVLLDLGPDEGTVHPVDPMIVVASTSLPNHDAVATSLLVHLDATVPEASVCSYPICTYSAGIADVANRFFVESIVPSRTGMPWGPHPVAEYESVVAHGFEAKLSADRPLLRAWEISGGRPEHVDVKLDGDALDPAARAAIEARGEGTIRFV